MKSKSGSTVVVTLLVTAMSLHSLAAAPASTGGPGIRTPPPAPLPRINGAEAFSVQPGHPFLFPIPATGQRPMKFSVQNLPEGLQVDPQTGQITGSVAKARNLSRDAHR